MIDDKYYAETVKDADIDDRCKDVLLKVKDNKLMNVIGSLLFASENYKMNENRFERRYKEIANENKKLKQENSFIKKRERELNEDKKTEIDEAINAIKKFKSYISSVENSHRYIKE